MPDDHSVSAAGGGVPVVSVVVPSHNRHDTIGRTVESVLAQTFRAFEVLVVDDGSTDGTAEVVQAIPDPRVHHLYQAHAGRTVARNRGAALARGEWLTFLDSDDAVVPEWLETLVAAARGPESVDVVSCGFRAVLKDPAAGYRTVGERLPSDLGPVYGHAVAVFTAGTFLLRRDLFDRIGGYAEGLEFAENTELALRLTAAGARITAIPRLLVLYTLRPPGQHPSSSGARARLEGARYILRHHGDRYRSVAPRAFANYCAIAGVNAARLDRIEEARSFFRGAVRAAPLDPRHHGRLLLSLIPRLARRRWMGDRRTGQEPRT